MTTPSNPVKTMTKKELALTLSSRCKIPANVARVAVNEAVAEMVAHLMTPGNRIEFRGFVSLVSRVMPGRVARNPRKPQERHNVPPKIRLKCITSPHFNLHTSTHTMPCPSGVGGNPGQ